MDSPGFHIAFNASAGTARKIKPEAIALAIEGSGINALSVSFFASQELTAGLKDLGKTGEPILLGGGDGTFMRCVEAFLDAPGRFGIIPMGTMNLLANDLGLPLTVEDTFKAYAQGAVCRRIDVGLVNGAAFLCCAAVGVIPEAANFREENRGQPDALVVPRLALFVFSRMNKAKRRFLVRLDGKPLHIRSSTLIISNNVLKEHTTFADPAFKKGALDGGEFGIYWLQPATIWDKLRMLLRLRIGNWKRDPLVVERRARSVNVRARRNEDVALDGEIHRFSSPLRFEILPRALTLLVPRSVAEKTGTAS